MTIKRSFGHTTLRIRPDVGRPTLSGSGFDTRFDGELDNQAVTAAPAKQVRKTWRKFYGTACHRLQPGALAVN